MEQHENWEIYYSDGNESDISRSSENENYDATRDENIVSEIESYSENEFKNNFRMRRSTVVILIDKYKTIAKQKKQKVVAKIDIYMFMWYICNKITFRKLASLFGVTKLAAWLVIERVSEFMLDVGKEFLKWPSHKDSKGHAKLFEKINGIPNIIGIIDVTHIPIKDPRKFRENYLNQKKFFSVALQVIVDPERKFIDISCGEPGSFQDGEVLRRSSLSNSCEDNMNDFFPTDTFLLGASSYPVRTWLVPSFKDDGKLTDSERSFNKVHYLTSVIVKNAIRLLKSRFPRLTNFNEPIDLNVLSKIVCSACVLHNICIMFSDEIDSEELVPENKIDNQHQSDIDEMAEGFDRRQTLFQELLNKNII